MFLVTTNERRAPLSRRSTLGFSPDDLEEPPGFSEPASGELASITELNVGTGTEEEPHRLRHEDLADLASSLDSGSGVHGRAEEIVALANHFAAVESDAEADHLVRPGEVTPLDVVGSR